MWVHSCVQHLELRLQEAGAPTPPGVGPLPWPGQSWEILAVPRQLRDLLTKLGAAGIHVCKIEHLKCTLRLQPPAVAAQLLSQGTVPGPACQLEHSRARVHSQQVLPFQGCAETVCVHAPHLDTDFLPVQHLFGYLKAKKFMKFNH